MLAVNAFRDDPSVWLIFVVSVGLASTSSMQRPSREALMPRTVTHDELPAANALTSLGMQLGVLVGPAVGGLLVAYVGIGWCFLIDIGGLSVASLMFWLMSSYPHREETTPPSLAGIGQGLTYALRRRDLLGTYLVDIVCMLLAFPVVLFPALAEEVFDKPQVLGLLYSAETVGALAATALSGWTARVHHHGRAIVIAAAAYGGFVALAGLMPSIWLVGVFLALSGAADMISGVFRGTVWSQTIPEAMRGPAGRHRDAVLLGRPARWAGPRRRHRRPVVGARRHHQRRRGLRRRGRAHRAVAARLLDLRRPHRRARRRRAGHPAGGRGELSAPFPSSDATSCGQTSATATSRHSTGNGSTRAPSGPPSRGHPARRPR